jgi:hypothetical protein
MGVDAILFLKSEKEIPYEVIDFYKKLYSWCYNGDLIRLKKDGLIIRISDGERYYGEDYERGPILDFIQKIEWARRNIPNIKIYYCSDSYYSSYDSEECYPPEWTMLDSIRILNHYWNLGEGPYRSKDLKPSSNHLPPDFVYFKANPISAQEIQKISDTTKNWVQSSPPQYKPIRY